LNGYSNVGAETRSRGASYIQRAVNELDAGNCGATADASRIMLKKIPDGEMKVLAGRFAGRPLAGVEGAEARPPARRSRESIFEFVGQRVCAGGG
jgi:hypothetical protein